jgi:hypothetical protein
MNSCTIIVRIFIEKHKRIEIKKEKKGINYPVMILVVSIVKCCIERSEEDNLNI